MSWVDANYYIKARKMSLLQQWRNMREAIFQKACDDIAAINETFLAAKRSEAEKAEFEAKRREMQEVLGELREARQREDERRRKADSEAELQRRIREVGAGP